MTSKGVALITGAGKGIGKAIALRLARDGYNIAINDIDSGALHQVKKEIQEVERVEVITHIGDVSKEQVVIEMVSLTTEKLGGLDVMVANAGIFLAKHFLDCTLEDWDKSFDINGKGVFLCYKYAAKKMIEQGRGGRIIGACSRAGKQGKVSLPLNEPLAFPAKEILALALKPHGITVNSYAPGTSINYGLVSLLKAFMLGLIDTPLGTQLIEDLKSLGSAPITEKLGTPEDVAGLVSYLASKEASYITGQSVSVSAQASGVNITQICIADTENID
ncbi:Diacetyl reductase [(S)-acetoin forming] [Leucoagaricus sp. SymC.cos]|nr:Diacetyl reductase [(S)-acetoin forming] [Leucoagaricus sp. SymC.cos]